MFCQIPYSWVSIDEGYLEAALNQLNYRKDDFGFYVIGPMWSKRIAIERSPGEFYCHPDLLLAIKPS